MDKIIYEIDTSNGEKAMVTDNLYLGRINVINSVPEDRKMDSDVTILVQAYNRIEKTKECIESILKYTKDVNFDLLLIDNGSTDETFEYFKSIDYEKIRIVHLSKNISPSYPIFFYDLSWFSKYFVCLGNDIIVTQNWLSNLIKVAESDMRIGMVVPVSSNTSNLQQVDLKFNNLSEMQQKAAEYNKSDPKKWHERLRLVTVGTLYKKEALYAIGWPINDIGFFHDFIDDDVTFRIRRAGYKTILARDTWIHHNHDIFHLENKNPEEFQKSLDIGQQNFKEKYFGVDAWEDVNNYVPNIVSKILPPTDFDNCCILGMDVKCGTPILEIKNKLREYDIFEPVCCAVTSDGKYFIDLQTVCGVNNVFTCSPDNAFGYFPQEAFDYIVIGNSINEYPEPFKVIKTAYTLLKRGGRMFFNLKNTFNIYSFTNIIGYRGVYPDTFAYNISCEAFINLLNQMGITAVVNGYTPLKNVKNELIKIVEQKINMFNQEAWNETKLRLTADSFSFFADKK